MAAVLSFQLLVDINTLSEDQMSKENYANWTLILSAIAAVLALSAALIGYLRHGEVRISLIAAGIFLLAFGLGARSRMGPAR